MKSPKSPQEGDSFMDQDSPHWQPKNTKSNLIELTRDYVKKYTDEQRMDMARQHVHNALRYKQPRFDILNSDEGHCYKMVYALQTSQPWEAIMSFLSFFYMYLIIFENTDYSFLYRLASPALYGVFLLDFAMQAYHQSYDQLTHKSRCNVFFILKIVFLTLVGVDELLVGLNIQVGTRPLHPFRVLRAVLPVIHNRQIGRSFQSLGSAYKDIFIYFIFYIVVVSAYAITVSQIISLPANSEIDDYKNNYGDLGKMIFITYVLGTYDAYPDNQLPAIRAQIYYYWLFILFIFLNMFIFSSIPGSLIFDIFRQTRSKLLLMDETKMQNSLIVAFVTLGDDNFQMDIRKVVKFLLYFYQNRVRFVDTVTSICLKLNPNDNSTIHINEFMQLGRILQQNSNLKPPLLSDWGTWIAFRRWVNAKLSLKNMVNCWGFKMLSALLALCSFINAVAFLEFDFSFTTYLDTAFVNLLMVELIIRIVAIGPELYFKQSFSGADFIIVFLGFILQFFWGLTDQDALLRTFRIFRASFLLEQLASNRLWKFKLPLYDNLQNLFKHMVTILPIIMKFMPLYFLTYYVLGVLGMELFYEAYQLQPSEQYSFYDEYSNFRTFIDTQLFLVQVLTEAGWSSVAFDVAYRMPNYFGLVMTLFASFHVIIVLILATLIKGIVLSTFLTVSSQYEQNMKEENMEAERIAKAKGKFQQLQMLEHIIGRMEKLKLDSIVKREVYESKMNHEVIDKLRKMNKNKSFTRKSIKEVGNQTFYRNFGINKTILEVEEEQKRQGDETEKYITFVIEKFEQERLMKENCGQYDLQDYEEQLEKIRKLMRPSLEKGISIEIKPNNLLNGHLLSKLRTPCSTSNKLNKQSNSVSLHIFDMHILLGIQTTWREQKTLVIRGLIERDVIREEEGHELLHKSVGDKGFRLDEDCTIRRTYLQGTHPKLIQKFEAEYFGNIYGKAFKEINKVTIEPLIKLESTMIYAMKNICRFPHISTYEFFRILAKVEDTISNQLLKNGSLFKFVFQLNCEKNIWFTFSFQHAKPCLSFLKHGVWLHNPSLQENQIYYGQDLFRFEKEFLSGELMERAALMKKLYETFQSLALTLEGKESFFDSNPQYHIYDNYFTVLNVEPVQRLIQRELEISKVMVVMLTKEKERTPQEEIPFEVSEIPIEKFEAQVEFKLDETESMTFKKLSALANMNDDEVTARQGLPFSYVLNFLQEIADILRLHSPNFLHHVESLLNTQLHEPTL